MSNSIETTKKLMDALVRMKPKPHEDMKLGRKTNDKKVKSPGPNKRGNVHPGHRPGEIGASKEIKRPSTDNKKAIDI